MGDPGRSPGSPVPRLLLFDVDGTLITAHGAGRAAMAHALREVYGTTGPIDAYDFRGRTDPEIVADLMRAAGVPEATVRARLGACLAAYVRALEPEVARRGVRVMPGLPALLAALARRPDALVGLLTGNVEAGARVKLAPTGLWPFVRLGAYGSDDADRRRLPAVACARARALLGRPVPFDRVTIIGDTPLDVDCARACGARAVAVATGWHSADELRACGPDHVFPDFSDVDTVLAALLDGAEP
jgi:phosphoglycolate phosphatase-like HAD superfamily hydrolase